MPLPTGALSTWDELRSFAAGKARPFDPATLHDLPPAAARLLHRALPEGTPLAAGVELQMDGQIKVGKWRDFQARQILVAGQGFVWIPSVGGKVHALVGADILGPSEARMEFRLFGILPVIGQSGHDIAKSAAGRLAAETASWLPQAMTPQCGARWRHVDNATAIVTLASREEAVELTVEVDEIGRLQSVSLDRWGNPQSRPFGSYPFGGICDDELVIDGVPISGRGRAGWWWGTPQQATGEFFQYRLTGAKFIH